MAVPECPGILRAELQEKILLLTARYEQYTVKNSSGNKGV
jgi:hypothetical protein